MSVPSPGFGPPTPSTARECVPPPPPEPKGETHSAVGEGVGGVPILTIGEMPSTLSFCGCTLQPSLLLAGLPYLLPVYVQPLLFTACLVLFRSFISLSCLMKITYCLHIVHCISNSLHSRFSLFRWGDCFAKKFYCESPFFISGTCCLYGKGT